MYTYNVYTNEKALYYLDWHSGVLGGKFVVTSHLAMASIAKILVPIVFDLG